MLMLTVVHNVFEKYGGSAATAVPTLNIARTVKTSDDTVNGSNK